MDSQQRTNAKRCIQALLPTVPGPLVDYALNSTFVTSTFVSLTKASSSHPGNQSDGEAHFTLRRMDSGDFGEFSLESLDAPRVGRHARKTSFGDVGQLQFVMAAPSLPGTGRPTRAAKAAPAARHGDMAK